MRKLAAVLLIALVAGILLAPSAEAQQSTATASANATATMITAIAITRTAHMNFGDVVTGASLGTVVLSAAASPTRSATGGTKLGNSTVVSSAIYSVTGEGSSTYSITLPTSDVTLTSGGNSMTLNTFTSSPSGTGTLSSGSQTLYVGATLHVGANQASGIYTGSFDVTVTYN
jgi:hypothetical protein